MHRPIGGVRFAWRSLFPQTSPLDPNRAQVATSQASSIARGNPTLPSHLLSQGPAVTPSQTLSLQREPSSLEEAKEVLNYWKEHQHLPKNFKMGHWNLRSESADRETHHRWEATVRDLQRILDPVEDLFRHRSPHSESRLDAVIHHLYWNHFFRHDDDCDQMKEALSWFPLSRVGNCVARALLLLSAVTEAGVRLRSGQKWGLQIYRNHVEAVLVDGDQIRVLATGEVTKKINAPVFDIAVLLDAHVRGQGEASPWNQSDFLLLAQNAWPDSPHEITKNPTSKSCLHLPETDAVYPEGPSRGFLKPPRKAKHPTAPNRMGPLNTTPTTLSKPEAGCNEVVPSNSETLPNTKTPSNPGAISNKLIGGGLIVGLSGAFVFLQVSDFSMVYNLSDDLAELVLEDYESAIKDGRLPEDRDQGIHAKIDILGFANYSGEYYNSKYVFRSEKERAEVHNPFFIDEKIAALVAMAQRYETRPEFLMALQFLSDPSNGLKVLTEEDLTRILQVIDKVRSTVAAGNKDIFTYKTNHRAFAKELLSQTVDPQEINLAVSLRKNSSNWEHYYGAMEDFHRWCVWNPKNFIRYLNATPNKAKPAMLLLADRFDFKWVGEFGVKKRTFNFKWVLGNEAQNIQVASEGHPESPYDPSQGPKIRHRPQPEQLVEIDILPGENLGAWTIPLQNSVPLGSSPNQPNTIYVSQATYDAIQSYLNSRQN